MHADTARERVAEWSRDADHLDRSGRQMRDFVGAVARPLDAPPIARVSSENMPATLTTFRCLLMSPGDVAPEREAVEQAVRRWNAHVGAGLEARIEVVAWETHSRPEMGAPPQAILNEQIVDGSDFGIAIFWSRLGTPTKDHLSGSAEEVERLIANNANVLVYFCTRAVPQTSLRDDQFDRLQELKKDYTDRGLYTTFETPAELAQHVTLHLTNVVAGHLTKLRAGNQPIPSTGTLTAPKPDIRVKAQASIAMQGSRQTGAYVRVEVQNHSPVPFFFESLSFAESNGKHIMPKEDALTKQYVGARQLAPGDSFQIMLAPQGWKLGENIIVGGTVRDKIDRTYPIDAKELAEAFAQHVTNLEAMKPKPPT